MPNKLNPLLNHIQIASAPDHEYATGNFQAALFVVHIASSASDIVLPLHKTRTQITSHKLSECWRKERHYEDILEIKYP